MIVVRSSLATHRGATLPVLERHGYRLASAGRHALVSVGVTCLYGSGDACTASLECATGGCTGTCVSLGTISNCASRGNACGGQTLTSDAICSGARQPDGEPPGQGSCSISGGSGAYSDNSTVTITVEKTCNLPTVQQVSYTVSGHL